MNTSQHAERSDAHHMSLGAFLRTRREKLSPALAGIAARERRRTPGLRREEVAQLANISYEWYTYLEQDRDVSPSKSVIERVADALQLNPAEREYLDALAFPISHASELQSALPLALRRFIDDLEHRPAYAVNDVWDIVGWNRAAEILFPDLTKGANGAQPNLVRFVFRNELWRALYKDWEANARKMLALFRMTVATHANHPRCLELVAELNETSSEFANWWRQQDVAISTSGNKVLQRADFGELSLDYTSFNTADDPSLTLIAFLPHDAASTAKLRMLFEGVPS